MSKRLKRPTGPSTRASSVRLTLGKYVVVKKRVDGSARVYFQVPERLRPSDWSPAIPLPREGSWPGNLNDAREIAAIQADAKALYDDLTGARLGLDAKAPERSLENLVLAWKASSNWPANKTTAKGYSHYADQILSWSESKGYPDPKFITRDDIERFLSAFNDRPSTKKHLCQVFRMIMDQALAKGWRSDNPVVGIRVKVETSRAMIWEQEDVDMYVAQAKRMGRDSIALIILLEWEIGQRLTDVRAFRPGAEYDAAQGVFRFWQSKTQSYVTIPISADLRDLLGPHGNGHLFLFRDEVTGKAYEETRLSKVFGQVRKAVAKSRPLEKLKPLKLKWLRHSCVVQLARNECTPVEIAAITGHAVGSIVTILSVYLPRDNEVAWNAQAKRGIV